MGRVLSIRVPASSANLGPGFDALSMGVGVYLHVKVHVEEASEAPSLSLSYDGVGSSAIAINVEANLLSKTISHVVNRANAKLPSNRINISVHNEIPLSKGLGSSAAAVVAGCVIANELCNLKFDKLQLMKYALEIENHPDNLSAALFGGFVVSCVDSNGECRAFSTEVSQQIQATIIVPDIEKKSTAEARAVLPTSYTRAETVFNIQRASLLTLLLSRAQKMDGIDNIFSVAMEDKIHQPYRKQLVPGLEEILDLPKTIAKTCPSFLGVCMSGAGPSVLILSKSGHNDERITLVQAVQSCFAQHKVTSVPHLVNIDNTGTWWEWQ